MRLIINADDFGLTKSITDGIVDGIKAGVVTSTSLMVTMEAAEYAINKALEDVENKETGEVPMHLRNAPVKEMKNEGYSVGYLYPHDFPNHWVEQQYLPDEMMGTKDYEPDMPEQDTVKVKKTHNKK